VGKEIYGCILKKTAFRKELVHPQYIVAVANKLEQATITKQLEGMNFFFFC